ncbi:MAG TPA: DNRLRE domain-containing protein [Actinomycetes bacterium]|nr:DNRLRE domain-containing protein [Actinomycetes bacterium]
MALLTGAAVLTAPPAPAATRTLSVTPVADTTVQSDKPTKVNGTSEKLSIDGSPQYFSFLKFAVSGVGTDRVVGARLRVYVQDAGPAGGVFSRVADTSWSESAMTWLNQPAADGTLATLGQVRSRTWYEVDVSALVTGDGVVSVRVSTPSSDKVAFKSREALSQRPELLLTLEPTPDEIDPSASIVAPLSGSTVSGTVDVDVDASDDRGVSSVDLLVDGTDVATDTDAPFTITWDTTTVGDGTHTLTAVARDAAGRTGISEQVVVSVSNQPPAGSITIGAAGDFGAGDRAKASLAALDTTGADLFLALGDLSYGETETEQQWCDVITGGLPTLGPTFPFQLLTGNHEDQGATDGYILNFAQCLPDRLASTVAPGSHYGVNYYFDYPADDPLVRVFMISPDHVVENVTYTFSAGDPHYTWLSGAIDDGRAAGIPWTVVGMHKPCISSSSAGCAVGQPLWNMLLDKRVDLILAGHNHNYQRSKQLALRPGTCPTFVLGGFSPACVSDNGTGVMEKGAGSVFGIIGNFGRTGAAIDPADPEAGYFASTDGVTNGFMTYTLSSDRLDAAYTATSGVFADAFSIRPDGGSKSDTTPPTTPSGLVATANGGDRVDLAWTPSEDNVTVDHYEVSRDGQVVATSGGPSYSDGSLTPGTTYSYVVRAVDSAGNVSGASTAAEATTDSGRVLTLSATDDATIRLASPTGSYGGSQELAVDGSPVEHAVVKFTVSGVGSGTVTAAKLRLYNLDASDAGGELFATADNGWTEGTVTWATAPDTVGTRVGSLGAVATGTWYEVDLGSLIRGDGVYSLRLVPTSTNAVKWASRQNAGGNGPVLAVTVAP